MPLSMVNAGEPFTIKRIGGKEEVKRHLEELGFVVDYGLIHNSSCEKSIKILGKEGK